MRTSLIIFVLILCVGIIFFLAPFGEHEERIDAVTAVSSGPTY